VSPLFPEAPGSAAAVVAPEDDSRAAVAVLEARLAAPSTWLPRRTTLDAEGAASGEGVWRLTADPDWTKSCAVRGGSVGRDPTTGGMEADCQVAATRWPGYVKRALALEPDTLVGTVLLLLLFALMLVLLPELVRGLLAPPMMRKSGIDV
jgi:hypothetical protein